MEPILRAVLTYVFLLLMVRVAGKRSLADTTPFDLVLLLIISEAAQQGMVGNDYSLTNSFIIVATLVLLDVSISFVKQKWAFVDRWVDGVAVVLVRDGKPLKDRMDKERIDEQDVMEAARELQGIERMEQIKYAVLERNGHISIIPK
ncbi:MAG TPA: YetF domain-containing protein [Candidatus Binatia bacterium]|jgi:uncharacterized membrane protein YcaP (DUF421 family)|nr:YetF domain-containing protein [Candidatus Binatia bacterium]